MTSMAAGALPRAAQALREARSVLVLTGAGISVESGIPTFRGPGGLWEGFRSEDLATPEAFDRDPEKIWRWYRWRYGIYKTCAPNPGHEAIAAMEDRYGSFLLATQNVDGLHRRAGSTRLVELHGTIDRMRCTRCHRVVSSLKALDDQDGPMPTCEDCQALMRPHILWFGESYWPGVLENALVAAEEADVALVAGTSAQVWPPAMLALQAQGWGAFLIDVNPERTPISEEADVHLDGAAGEVLPALMEAAVG